MERLGSLRHPGDEDPDVVAAAALRARCAGVRGRDRPLGRARQRQLHLRGDREADQCDGVRLLAVPLPGEDELGRVGPGGGTRPARHRHARRRGRSPGRTSSPPRTDCCSLRTRSRRGPERTSTSVDLGRAQTFQLSGQYLRRESVDVCGRLVQGWHLHAAMNTPGGTATIDSVVSAEHGGQTRSPPRSRATTLGLPLREGQRSRWTARPRSVAEGVREVNLSGSAGGAASWRSSLPRSRSSCSSSRQLIPAAGSGTRGAPMADPLPRPRSRARLESHRRRHRAHLPLGARDQLRAGGDRRRGLRRRLQLHRAHAGAVPHRPRARPGCGGGRRTDLRAHLRPPLLPRAAPRAHRLHDRRGLLRRWLRAQRDRLTADLPEKAERTVAQLNGSVDLAPELPFSGFHFRIGVVDFGFVHVFAIAATLLLLAAVAAFLRYTRIGVAVRALAENSERAALLGISVGFVSSVVWCDLSALLSGASATMSGLLGTPSGSFGFSAQLLLPALAAAVLARMSSISVAVVASIGIELFARSLSFLQPELATDLRRRPARRDRRRTAVAARTGIALGTGRDGDLGGDGRGPPDTEGTLAPGARARREVGRRTDRRGGRDRVPVRQLDRPGLSRVGIARSGDRRAVPGRADGMDGSGRASGSSASPRSVVWSRRADASVPFWLAIPAAIDRHRGVRRRGRAPGVAAPGPLPRRRHVRVRARRPERAVQRALFGWLLPDAGVARADAAVHRLRGRAVRCTSSARRLSRESRCSSSATCATRASDGSSSACATTSRTRESAGMLTAAPQARRVRHRRRARRVRRCAARVSSSAA